MGQINVKKTVIRRKNPTKPQRKIVLRKVVINNQIHRFNAAAKRK